MKKFYVYVQKWKVYELIKVIECKDKQEAYNGYSYLDYSGIQRLIIKTKLMTGLNVENGDYKE
jgi:hypothetical protein